MKYDLHCHTTASDGRLTPIQIIDRAVDNQIDVLAITDHDTVTGLDEAHQHIQQKGYNLKLINGIEISTLWRNYDIHIVGLGIDHHSPQLISFNEQQWQRRYERAKAIAKRLTKYTKEDAWTGVRELAGEANITRAHFARWLIENGWCTDWTKVFKNFLSKGNIGYVAPTWGTVAEAVSIIHSIGGQAVLAHPMRYQLSRKWTKYLLADFVAAKGDAVEVALSQQHVQDRRKWVDLSHEFSLLASQGSDFHSPSPWSELGKNLWLPPDAIPVWKDWPEARLADELVGQQEAVQVK